MKTNYKILSILLISIFLLSTLPIATADDVDYSITQAIMDVTVDSNGMLHISEELDYYFDSKANGVYRTIPLKKGESIDNLRVSVDGAYAEYELTEYEDEVKIKVYLYKDAAKTQKINAGTAVRIYYDYDFNKVTNIYTDTGELHYKVWGDEWDMNPWKLTANIHLPSKKGVKYWINPYGTDADVKWKGNTLTLTVDDVDSYVELRALIPLSQFDNPTYANHINEPGIDKINDIQNDYEFQAKASDGIFGGGVIAFLLSLLAPVLVFFKFGREEKIAYDGIYEREPPTNDSPAFVNGMTSETCEPGLIDLKAFQATIMDLIDRKVLSIDIGEGTDFTNETFIIINEENVKGLKDFEIGVINLLSMFEYNGRIGLERMESDLKDIHTSESFRTRYNQWEDDFKNEYLSSNIIEEYFDSKGADYITYIATAWMALGFLIAIITYFFDFYHSGYFMVLGIAMIAIGFITNFIPSTVGGKWTLKGREFDARWKNFKKFITDYSMMKENPPESIAIWNKYLVYATALGVADKVYETMKMEVYSSGDGYFDNDVYMYHYYGGYALMDNNLVYGTTDPSSDSGGGFGGAGGGSGGGGGGAF